MLNRHKNIWSTKQCESAIFSSKSNVGYHWPHKKCLYFSIISYFSIFFWYFFLFWMRKTKNKIKCIFNRFYGTIIKPQFAIASIWCILLVYYSTDEIHFRFSSLAVWGMIFTLFHVSMSNKRRKEQILRFGKKC